MEKYKIDAIPFDHKNLEDWRNNFVGIQYYHPETGITVSGAVDDLWINSKDEIHVVDYKSTSKDEINMEDKWKQGYKRQLEVYQWLLRKNGFNVSDKAFFVYANGDTGAEKFDGKLEFDTTIIEHIGDTEWVEPTIFAIKETLDKDILPPSGLSCEHCAYHYNRNEAKDSEDFDIIEA